MCSGSYALRFTFAVQVYGGAISMFIGAYVWSLAASGSSNSTSGDTHCIDCGVAMLGISIMNSGARSITSGTSYLLWLPSLYVLVVVRKSFCFLFASYFCFTGISNQNTCPFDNFVQVASPADHL
jgi:hypothetical protein